MPLLMFDLDNTLVDRAGAYRAWAASLVAERGVDPTSHRGSALVDAMVAADGDGHRPKPEVGADLTVLLGLSPAQSADIVRVLRAGVVRHLALASGCADALRATRAAGWTPFIVSNGVTRQQETKIHDLGLDALVDGWVISGEAGVEKPDPRIIQIASERAGVPLTGAWLVGDSAEADVAGAHAAGVRSVYLRRGRPWTATVPEPTAYADSLAEAVAIVTGQ